MAVGHQLACFEVILGRGGDTFSRFNSAAMDFKDSPLADNSKIRCTIAASSGWMTSFTPPPEAGTFRYP